VSLVRFEGLEFFPAGAMASDPRHRLGRLVHFAKELPKALPRIHKSGDYRTSYRDQWRHFVDCISQGTPMRSTLAEGRPSLAAMVAAMESAESGEVVGVSTITA
jgi:predicted dehydrogenase